MNASVPKESMDKDKINGISKNDEDRLQETVQEVFSFSPLCGFGISQRAIVVMYVCLRIRCHCLPKDPLNVGVDFHAYLPSSY